MVINFYTNPWIGLIGIVVNGGWYEPATGSQEDLEASETELQFEVNGNYSSPNPNYFS